MLLLMWQFILQRGCTYLVVSAVVILKCVNTTPFGRPVDPLELNIKAGKSLICLILASSFSSRSLVTFNMFPLQELPCFLFNSWLLNVGSKISSKGRVCFGSGLPFESQTNICFTFPDSKYCSSFVSHTDIEHSTNLGWETDKACSHSPEKLQFSEWKL